MARNFSDLVLINVVAMRTLGLRVFRACEGSYLGFHRASSAHPCRHRSRHTSDSALVHALSTEDDDQLVAPWLTPAGQIALFGVSSSLPTRRSPPKSSRKYGALRCPYFDPLGSRRSVDPDLSRGWRSPNGSGVALTPLPGLGHLPQLEAPEVVLRELFAVSFQTVTHPRCGRGTSALNRNERKNRSHACLRECGLN